MIINQKIWIIGFGGIGQAIYDLVKNENKVSIFSSKKILDTKFNNIQNSYLDFNYTDEEYKKVIEETEKEDLPDIVIITCGRLHDDENKPEKTISRFNEDWLYKSTKYNVLPTAYFAKNISKKLNKNKKIILVSFSARVGSISDNKFGGWHSYRMTKAMLNMLIKNISKEWAVKSPESIVISYHPGTVDTELSRPYHKAAGDDTILSADQAAKYLLDLVNNLDATKTGQFFDYNGININT